MNKVTSYNGLYNDVRRKDLETHYGGFWLSKDNPLPFKESFKTYPTHRLYSVWVFKEGQKFNQGEKSFFRDLGYSLLTQNHDFKKSFRKQVSDFYEYSRVTTKYNEGKLFYSYEMKLREPVKLKMKEFEHQFQANPRYYKKFHVTTGLNMRMGTTSTKLRTKRDTQFFEEYNKYKMVA